MVAKPLDDHTRKELINFLLRQEAYNNELLAGFELIASQNPEIRNRLNLTLSQLMRTNAELQHTIQILKNYLQ